VNLLKTEPVLLALIPVLITLAVAFGLQLSPAQISAITGVVAAVAAVFARSQVTPVSKLTDLPGGVTTHLP